MDLWFSSSFNPSIIKAYSLLKHSNKKAWEDFYQSIPTLFSSIRLLKCYKVAAVVTHLRLMKIIKSSKNEYVKWWGQFGKEVVNRLDLLFDTVLKEKLKCYICVSPLYIRNINKNFFLLPCGCDNERVAEIIIHELSHFYFYMYRNQFSLSDEQFWLLSEQIVPYIINYCFPDICRYSGAKYYEEPSIDRQAIIKLWANRVINFNEFILKNSGNK